MSKKKFSRSGTAGWPLASGMYLRFTPPPEAVHSSLKGALPARADSGVNGVPLAGAANYRAVCPPALAGHVTCFSYVRTDVAPLVASAAPALAAQTRPVASHEAVTMREPSGLTAALFTRPVCPATAN